MALSAVDQLNNLETSYKPRAMDYETYFGEMELSEEEIQERIELAEDLDDVFEYLFVLYLAMLKAGKKVDRDELVQTVLTRYRDVLYDNDLDIDERYPGMYGISQRSSESIVDTTIAYGALNDWYTSEDRAMFLAENEANTIANYEDLMDAIDAGYTTKTWVTMADRKVRETHRDLEGVTISIFEPFDVGGYQMMVPKDDSMGAGPEEIVNCRCSMAWGGLEELEAERETDSLEREREYGVEYGSEDRPLMANTDYINSNDFISKFKSITDNPETNAKIAEYAKRAVLDNSGTLYESMYLIDAKSGDLIASIDSTVDKKELYIEYTNAYKNALNMARSNGAEMIAIHNHPMGDPPSLDDISSMAKHGYTHSLVIGANGQVYSCENPMGKLFDDETCAGVHSIISQDYRQGIDIDRAHLSVYKEFDVGYTILKGE